MPRFLRWRFRKTRNQNIDWVHMYSHPLAGLLDVLSPTAAETEKDYWISTQQDFPVGVRYLWSEYPTRKARRVASRMTALMYSEAGGENSPDVSARGGNEFREDGLVDIWVETRRTAAPETRLETSARMSRQDASDSSSSGSGGRWGRRRRQLIADLQEANRVQWRDEMLPAMRESNRAQWRDEFFPEVKSWFKKIFKQGDHSVRLRDRSARMTRSHRIS